jgi:hypothetical protein
VHRTLGHALVKFDAIFILNQDLLFDRNHHRALAAMQVTSGASPRPLNRSALEHHRDHGLALVADRVEKLLHRHEVRRQREVHVKLWRDPKKADLLLRRLLFDRVYAMKIRGFVQQFRGAEKNGRTFRRCRPLGFSPPLQGRLADRACEQSTEQDESFQFRAHHK